MEKKEKDKMRKQGINVETGKLRKKSKKKKKGKNENKQIK
jgi:hypothetical protein